MSRIRSAGNAATELRFLHLLRTAGLTGWRRKMRLPGRPDIVFGRERVAVFLDGCFWHACPRCYTPPRSNVDYWGPKIARNVARDKKVAASLRAAGWIVVRVWQHSIRAHPGRTLRRVELALQKRQQTTLEFHFKVPPLPQKSC
jgi:DNA mismatch endonuclease (patch repair protein)